MVFDFFELQNYMRFLYEEARRVRANPVVTVLQSEEDTELHFFQGKERKDNKTLGYFLLGAAISLLGKDAVKKHLNKPN